MNRTVWLFSLALTFILTVGCGSNNSPSTPISSGSTYTYPFSLLFGDYATSGTGNGQLNGPEGIAVHNNALFEVDNGTNRIQKFDLSGNFMQSVTVTATSIWGITIDINNIMYISDSGATAIYKYDTNLNSLGTFNTSIAPNGPENMATDANGKIYFVNWNANNVESCNNNGSGCVTTTGGAGSALGQFNGPYGVAVDSSGNVYAGDSGNNRVQKFNSSLASPSLFIGPGTANGSVTNVTTVAIDWDGNFLVGDAPVASASRLQKFSSSGSFLTTIAPPTAIKFGNDNLIGIAFDTNKNTYVSDWSNNVVYKFAPN